MGRLVVTGCSITAGGGFIPPPGECKEHPDLWINLLHKNNAKINQYHLENRSHNGTTNSIIFEDSIESLLGMGSQDILIVTWTSVPRYIFSAGFELYDTSIRIHSKKQRDYHLNDQYIPEKYLDKICSELMALHHYHYEYTHVLRQSNLLINLANSKGVKIYFCHPFGWDQGFFDRSTNPDLLPSDFTPLTQKLINVENRSDDEALKLYHRMHDDFDQVGGMKKAHWIDFEDALVKNKIDKAKDGLHPGPKTHYNWYKILDDFFNKQDNV